MIPSLRLAMAVRSTFASTLAKADLVARDEGLPILVWVSETRPRMQGANLTAWDFTQRGIAQSVDEFAAIFLGHPGGARR